MASNLVIVESPAKAKTIEKILGSDFRVKSSMGHIRDLEKGNKGVDIENKFEPSYIVSPDKKHIVKDLKSSIKKNDVVWLATDEDREGEAISWHLCEVLGLDVKTTKRIVFREITKPAILKAIEAPRLVDTKLVDAQQARRILDRLVGFELSGILWRKVKNKLSAGRVQSVAVKLIVDKEREILAFKVGDHYKVAADFSVTDKNGRKSVLSAALPRKIDSKDEALKFLEACQNATFSVAAISKKPLERKPAAPFTTSTLQQEASRKLGFGVKRTMIAAQRLYEQGFISYMRTDSVSLSETALSGIATEITKRFGDDYLNTRRYKSKKSNTQEAHEAIRPSYMENESVPSGDRDQQRLYQLIWQRTISSQMSNARLEKTTVNIAISTLADDKLKAEGEVLLFDGFLKVYLESKDDDSAETTKGILPPLNQGQDLPLKVMNSTQRFTRPPARYTEAGLVKKMEELGIGRPSTYAPTITKIMEPNRGYVLKESRDGHERKYANLELKSGVIKEHELSEITGTTKNRLYASDIGMVVSDFLSKHFDKVMDYGFTADIERQFDLIASGAQPWKEMLSDFYDPFHAVVTKTIDEAERESGERILGKDPETGRTVLVRISKFGKAIAQLGSREELGEDEKAKFGNLQNDQSLESITLEEALKLFALPKDLGNYEDQPVSVNAGRYGPYVKWGETFISLPKGMDPMTVEMEQATPLIVAKQEADRPIGTYLGEGYTKGKGRFGPFLKWKEFFVNVPKRYDFENISPNECIELIQAKIEKEKLRVVQIWEDLKLSIEMDRWGPVIKFKKKKINLPRVEGKRATREQALELSLEEVKALVEAQMPDAFAKKKPRAKAKPKAKKK